MIECDRCGKKIQYGALCEYCKGHVDGFSQGIDEAIEYFEKNANGVYEAVCARDYICDRLEMLKEQNK